MKFAQTSSKFWMFQDYPGSHGSARMLLEWQTLVVVPVFKNGGPEDVLQEHGISLHILHEKINFMLIEEGSQSVN